MVVTVVEELSEVVCGVVVLVTVVEELSEAVCGVVVCGVVVVATVTTGVATSVIVGATVSTESPLQSATDIAMLVWVLMASAAPAIVVERTSATLASAT